MHLSHYDITHLPSTNTPTVVLMFPAAVDTTTLTVKYPGVLYEWLTVLEGLWITCEPSPYKK